MCQCCAVFTMLHVQVWTFVPSTSPPPLTSRQFANAPRAFCRRPAPSKHRPQATINVHCCAGVPLHSYCCMFVPCSSDPPETSKAVYRQSPPRSFTCGRCDCQPLICRRRHASMPTSARALPQCPARHLLREMLASYPTTVVLRRFPQHPSVGGIFSTVGQHRRRVVPGEELTYLSAAPRTSSPRDTLRRV